MSLKKKLIIASSLLFTALPLYAAWNVNDFLSIQEQVLPNPQEDGQFLALKEKVKNELKNSWCSQEKTNLLMDITYILEPQVCVEIGAFTGSSILPVASTLRYLRTGKIYAIDAWSTAEATRYMTENDPNLKWWSGLDMNSIRLLFNQLIDSWNLSTVCTPLAMTSAEALSYLPEIDFLHLDGDPSEEGSFFDAKHYVEKVKSGGYILLSNVYHTVQNKQLKFKSFFYLFETCEYIADVDNDNTVLFRKL